MAEFGRLLADKYRQDHGLLTSVEIRSRRKRLGMTQEEFARHLGVGIASVKRWEMGKIQDQRSNECIIWKTEQQPSLEPLAVHTFSVEEGEKEFDYLLTAQEIVKKWKGASVAANMSLAGSGCTITGAGGIGIWYYAGAYNTSIPTLDLGPHPVCHGLFGEIPSQVWAKILTQTPLGKIDLCPELTGKLSNTEEEDQLAA